MIPFAAAWAVLRRNKDLALIVAGLVALSLGAWSVARWHNHAVTDGFNRGADSVNTRAALVVAAYEEQLGRMQTRKDSIVRRVDTVTVRVKAASAKATEAVAALPDSLRNVPEVIAVSQAVSELTRNIDSLLAIRITERQAFTDIHTLDSTAIRAQATRIAQQNDSIGKLILQRDARVTKPKVVMIATTALAGGIAIGKWVLPLFWKD